LTASVGQVNAALRLSELGTPSAVPDSTLVIISDIHLNADPTASWIMDHLPNLEAFLTSVNGRSDVSELIINGDLFDTWVRPYGQEPESFQQTIDAPHNAGVIAALQAICANPNIQVTYITGNHDMLSFEAENQSVIASAFPEMTIFSESPGLGAYSIDSVIWLEHGHRYGLFNAPDIWTRPDGHLPLGYFITRLAAAQSERDGVLYTLPDILREFGVKTRERLNERRKRKGRKLYATDPRAEGVLNDWLIYSIFLLYAKEAGASSTDSFLMDGLDDFVTDPTVSEIATAYETIMSEWPVRQNIVSNDLALWNEEGYLALTADMLLEMPSRIQSLYPFTPRIVLFGHTHRAFFQQTWTDPGSIYINTGTWIDPKPMTWAEIGVQDQPGVRIYNTALWYDGDTSARYTGSIQITQD
jgi:UDP-2,3-diacylglucosamine pyrophosphatase LpxH